MASLLDTVGGYQQLLGLPGSPATGTIAELDTVFNEASSGGIDSAGMVEFGCVVARGTSADNAARPLTAGYLDPIGISARLPRTAAPTSTNLIGYPTGIEFGVFRLGDVVVLAAEAATAGDEVVALATPYSPSTGISTNVGSATGGVANGSTRIKVARHVWKTTTSQGARGIVSVSGRDINPATS
jgi:hypothetical protein